MSKFKKIGVIIILVGIGLPLVTFFWAEYDDWTVPPDFKKFSIPIFISMADVTLKHPDFVLREDKIEGKGYNYRAVQEARKDGYSDWEIAEYLWKRAKEESIEQSSYRINYTDYGEFVGEISIPYRYILLLSSILVLTGVGLVVLSKNKKKDQTNEIHNS